MLFFDCVNCAKLTSLFLHFCFGYVCCRENTSPTSFSEQQLHQIVSSLDNTINPCVDFYGYACNNWEENHADMGFSEITGQVEKEVNIQMMNIMDTAYQHVHQVNDRCQSFVQKSRVYYKSCLAEKQRNISRYFEFIKPSKTLEWPLLEELYAYQLNTENLKTKDWPRDEWNALDLLGELQSYGLNKVLINQEVSRSRDGLLHIVLDLPYVSEEDFIPQEAFMIVLSGFGLPEELSLKYSKSLENTQEKWHGIYQQFADNALETRDKSLNLTYHELNQTYPQLGIFLNQLLGEEIQAADHVLIANLNYMQFLANELANSSQDQMDLCNYLMLKFLAFLLEDSTVEFTALDCIKDLRNKMDLALNYLYYEKIYLPKSVGINSDIKFMSQDIKKYFLEILKENNLRFNHNELRQLENKIESITVNLGNLPTYLVTSTYISQIEEFYKEIPPLEMKNYYYNHLQLLRHRFQKSLLNIQNQTFFIAPDNRVGSSSGPFYSPKQHMAILPLGFLQTPIYHFKYEPLFKWSLLGFLLAHEFTHSIDTMGLMYDPNGFLLIDDSNPLYNRNFSTALDCIQMQERTDAIDERIADLMGARVAYKAYLRLYQSRLQPSISQIPWKQLFFLNMAQFFCGRKNIIFLDHDKDEIRLREIVKNSDEFVEAFKCPLGSPNNPEEKCRVF